MHIECWWGILLKRTSLEKPRRKWGGCTEEYFTVTDYEDRKMELT